MDLINQYTRTPLTADQVYTFKLQLCDNEIDRQYEQFTPNALKQLSALFVGKTVIFNHSWNATDQVARIYSTKIETIAGQTTKDGQPYMRLTAMAYLLKRPVNEDVIASIDGGILKEGSVAFSNKKSICSVCGNDYYSGDCPHWRGKAYAQNGEEKICHVILDDVTDAYEFSLVAVPAQPKAGVTKGLNDSLPADVMKKLMQARDLRQKAQEYEKQACAIEDALVGTFCGDSGLQPDSAKSEEPEDIKKLRAKIQFILGGKTE